MLSHQIKALRNQKNISQEQLAEKMNLSRQAIAKWESGEAVPELVNLIALAGIFQVTLDELACGGRPCTGTPSQNKADNTAAMVTFLLCAGKATYAGKGHEVALPSAPGAHEFEYAKEEWLYRDRYFGGLHFAGEETLFQHEICLWVMNYCGRTLSEHFNPDFLKAALQLRPVEMPYRGPALYRDGRYTYHNAVEGGFDWFSGREAIFCDEERVFECVYHGGSVVGQR